MADPFGSMNGFIGQFKGFMQNPMQFMLQRKLNLPQGMNFMPALEMTRNEAHIIASFQK